MDPIVPYAFQKPRGTQHGLVRTAVSFLILFATAGVSFAQPTATPPPEPDPFFALRQARGEIALVPPRALAVIPERHVGRRIRVTDVLTAIDPQFDDFSRGAGLSTRISIQIRTREAKIPIFVAKNEATIATLLQLSPGATVELVGILIERAGRYLFLASDVRSSPRPAHK